MNGEGQTIRESISKLADGHTLTRQDAHAALVEIMNGEATPSQIAAFITALRIRGETSDIIAGCAQAMREHFTAIEHHADIVVDTCGTGGDGARTFNISTAAAFVAAGAGVTVAKHGNRSVSSKCGSADVLSSLGVDITISPDETSECLNELGIAFLFAPVLHPAMKHAIGPRREIGIRTVFNILGPLSNPAGARHGVLGVYSRSLVPTLAEAAASLGAERVFVVHGTDGLDEITLTGPTLVGEVVNGMVSIREITPEDAGLKPCLPDQLAGGGPGENADIMTDILSGEKSPRRDIVLFNAAAAIVAGGKAGNLKDGVDLAAESIDSGSAAEKLEKLVRFTTSKGSNS